MRVAGGLGVFLVGSLALGQSREPLCVTTRARRLVSGPYLRVNGSDRVVARPFPQGSPTAFLVAVRDPDHSLRVGDSRGLTRGPQELGWVPPRTTPRPSGMTFLRVDTDLAVQGEAVFVRDPVESPRPPDEETIAPGIPVGATVDAGVLVLEHLNGDLYATVVPPSGPVPEAHRVAEAPVPIAPDAHRGFVWLTMVERGAEGHRGALALAGTDDGSVVSLRFDGAGARMGEPSRWSRRVGGVMTLLPVPEGARPVALLERPVRGTTATGAQAREQVLVRLDDALEPVGEPERTGLGPYPTGYATRGSTLVLTQWAEARGLALATLPVRDGAVALELPRIWTTTPFAGVPLGHAMVRGGTILYDFMLHGDDVAGALHGYLAWVPPAGAPFARREVLPLRARVLAPPALLPAEDGFVAVLAEEDETGAGVDAVHVRCELVTFPAPRP